MNIISQDRETGFAKIVELMKISFTNMLKKFIRLNAALIRQM